MIGLNQGIFNACLNTIRQDLGLSNSEAGLVESCSNIGFLCAAVFYAWTYLKCLPMRTIAVSMAIWISVLFMQTFTTDLLYLSLCRFTISFLEGSVNVLGPPILYLLAPSTQTTIWISVFLLGLAVSGWIGAGVVGFWLDRPTERPDDWRSAFTGLAFLELPLLLALFCFIYSTNIDEQIITQRTAQSALDPFMATLPGNKQAREEGARLLGADNNPNTNPSSDATLEREATSASKPIVRELLKNSVVVTMTLSSFFVTLVAQSFFVWVFSYLENYMGQSRTQARARAYLQAFIQALILISAFVQIYM